MDPDGVYPEGLGLVLSGCRRLVSSRAGKSNCTKTIQDQEMYEANKAECRKDMAAFDELLWKLEDQGTVDTAKNTDTEEQRA